MAGKEAGGREQVKRWNPEQNLTPETVHSLQFSQGPALRTMDRNRSQSIVPPADPNDMHGLRVSSASSRRSPCRISRSWEHGHAFLVGILSEGVGRWLDFHLESVSCHLCNCTYDVVVFTGARKLDESQAAAWQPAARCSLGGQASLDWVAAADHRRQGDTKHGSLIV